MSPILNWRRWWLVVVALVLVSGLSLRSQTAAQATPKPPKPQFFAGQVMEVDATHIKVTRNLVGRPTETRVFVMDSNTKTPAAGLKPKTRVTVRYEHLPQQDLALEIQIRPANRKTS